MTEQEMREMKAYWPKTEKELLAYVRKLIKQEHDYDTCVYAMSLASVAMFNYVGSKLGVTGFQASCADLDILRLTRGLKSFQLLKIEDLLYPQNCTEEYFPSVKNLMIKHKKFLQQEARRLLKEKNDYTHPDVLAHWKMLAKGVK